MGKALSKLAKEIESLDYVIMRNWEIMPPDGDIDFWVSEKDLDKLYDACEKYLEPRWYDIRCKGDDYYTDEIEDMMLVGRRKYEDWWIPGPMAHYISLMYHGVVHKGDNRYDERLKRLFVDLVKPRPPKDLGVGFHDFSKN